MPQDLNISLTSSGPSPSIQDCDPGDKITWTNNTGVSVDAFTLPTCVSPQTDPAPIAAGDTTRKYTVNNGTNGEYGYSYDIPSPKEGALNGTIDVS